MYNWKIIVSFYRWIYIAWMYHRTLCHCVVTSEGGSIFMEWITELKLPNLISLTTSMFGDCVWYILAAWFSGVNFCFMQEDQFKRITRELQTERRNHKQVRVFFVSGLRQGDTCIMQIESFVPV